MPPLQHLVGTDLRDAGREIVLYYVSHERGRLYELRLSVEAAREVAAYLRGFLP